MLRISFVLLFLFSLLTGAFNTYSQETARFTETGQFAVGTTTPDASAIVDISSNNRGVLVPRLTTAERDAISNPPEGLFIYNTTLDKFEHFDGNSWRMVMSSSSSPSTVAEGGGFCSEGVMDWDSNYYRTVKIGNQCWMAENLVSLHYADGTAITGDYNYGDNNFNARAFGKLYTWAAVMNGESSSDENPSGVQGICPDGWHLPSENEWKRLEYTLGMSYAEYETGGYRGSHYEGAKLKETDDAHLWDTGTGSCPGNNLTGFSALPGGKRDLLGDYSGKYSSAYFWSCTEYADNTTYAYPRYVTYNDCGIGRNLYLKVYAMSVRCVRD
jgi:uncharacterized protein (TIGR02145 family)